MLNVEREALLMNAVAEIFEIAPWTMNRCHPILFQHNSWLPLPNVWLGTSVERQQEANERIPLLLQTPAAVRFISAEPLLGPIDLTSIQQRFWARGQHMNALTGAANPSLEGMAPKAQLDWVIAGGENGPRPMHSDWARSLRDQCSADDTPFFFKQWGRFIPEMCAERDHQGAHTSQTFGKSCFIYQGELFWSVGKKAAGRLLDGIEHNGMPKAVGTKR